MARAMTADREAARAAKQERMKALRERLANLGEDERKALLDRGLVATVEGRVLSMHNTLMVYLQSSDRIPTVVGGYRQWLKAGKQVQKGAHGMIIWFPAGEKNEDDDIVEASHFYTTTVFDISQVADKEEHELDSNDDNSA